MPGKSQRVWGRVGVGVGVVLLMAGCRHAPVFSSDVTTAAKPWTHLHFRNDPEAFQFAIVTDRTGGHRPGIFESAVDKLNLLQPEFVITVGDAIEGYTEDVSVLDAQWAEFLGFVNRLEMPFFFVPGNHDNINPVMREAYRQRFGRDYYAFVYRDVLFLALDTQDGASAGLGPEQVAWALRTLQAHADARWTLLFMHQPLWLHEEGGVTTARKSIGPARATGFGEIMQALEGRRHTVFAGHFHEYVQFERMGEQYYILSTTGGGSALRGPAFGEFDHAVWVTMTPDGPRVANLLLDGILPGNLRTEAHARFRQSLALRVADADPVDGSVRVAVEAGNPFKHRLHAELSWSVPEGQGWTVTPGAQHMHVPSGRTNTLETVIRLDVEGWPTGLPVAQLRAVAGHDLPPTAEPLRMTLPADPFLLARRPTATAARAAVPPVLDGRLDDPVWQAAAAVRDFRHSDLRLPAVATTVRMAHDDEALYFAFDCAEPDMAALRAQVVERDGPVWEDDSVEIMVGRTDLTNAYTHLAISAAGTIYDAIGRDRQALDGQARVVTARGEAGWQVEVALPWSDLGGRPPPEQEISLQLVRSRVSERATYQYPPLNGSNHRHALHGRLQRAP